MTHYGELEFDRSNVVIHLVQPRPFRHAMTTGRFVALCRAQLQDLLSTDERHEAELRKGILDFGQYVKWQDQGHTATYEVGLVSCSACLEGISSDPHQLHMHDPQLPASRSGLSCIFCHAIFVQFDEWTERPGFRSSLINDLAEACSTRVTYRIKGVPDANFPSGRSHSISAHCDKCGVYSSQSVDSAVGQRIRRLRPARMCSNCNAPLHTYTVGV